MIKISKSNLVLLKSILKSPLSITLWKTLTFLFNIYHLIIKEIIYITVFRRPLNTYYCPFPILYSNFRRYNFIDYIFRDFYFLQISFFLTNCMSPPSYLLFQSLRFRMSQFSVIFSKNCKIGNSSLVWLHFGFRDNKIVR